MKKGKQIKYPIFIVGYMGSGKSTIGKLLSNQLNTHFIDLDTRIESFTGKSINDIFQGEGSNEFRRIEAKVLRSINIKEFPVISVGGGTPCYENGMDYINQKGKSIYLQIGKKQLFDRLCTAKQDRPLVKELGEDKLKARIRRDLRFRVPFYRRADIVVKNTTDAQSCVQRILSKLDRL